MPALDRHRILSLAALAACAALLAPGAGAERNTISVNWAGYSAFGTSFSDVSASWVQPAASCFGHSGTAAAFWVGLGGWRGSSHKVEQIGTEADCSDDGYPYHFAWYELYPAPPVNLEMEIAPGDRMSGLVRVHGTRVTVQLRNRTTHATFTKTLTMRAPDVTSANWIAEAPIMTSDKHESYFPLTDFGGIRFADAHATTASGHAGTIGDRAWKHARVFFSSTHRHSTPTERFFSEATAAHVIPTALSPTGDSFAARWLQGRPGETKPTKPGSGSAL